MLTSEFLKTEYLIKKKSLGEIAKECGCRRQFVHDWMREYGIIGRKLTEARQLAFDRGKITRSSHSDGQKSNLVTLQKVDVDENFFSKWSDEMAYLLGVICTDGTVQTKQTKRGLKSKVAVAPRLRVGQKEPELLNKVLSLLKCDARIHFRPKKGISGELHSFQIANQKIVDDLVLLGVTPNKSRVLRFPSVPSEQMRHFIRGCWDGHGSISLNGDRASFVSGSINFIIGLARELKGADIKCSDIKTRKYKTSRGLSGAYVLYTFGQETQKLFHYLYDGVGKEMFLRRKYDRFLLSDKLRPSSSRVAAVDILDYRIQVFYSSVHPRCGKRIAWADHRLVSRAGSFAMYIQRQIEKKLKPIKLYCHRCREAVEATHIEIIEDNKVAVPEMKIENFNPADWKMTPR